MYADNVNVQLCQTNYMAVKPTHGVYQPHMRPTSAALWVSILAIAQTKGTEVVHTSSPLDSQTPGTRIVGTGHHDFTSFIDFM